MSSKNIPVVSIIVITYNSEKYILDTLESIKKQNNNFLELIISDDASTDNTIEFCKNWIHKNKDSFLEAKILSADKNQGIPANCNKGINVAKGTWIKIIAGDDILLDNYLTDHFIAIEKFPNDKIFVSNMKGFINLDKMIDKVWKPAGISLCDGTGSSGKQYQFLLKNYFGNSPTLFIKREVFDTVQYDEEIRFMEDYPFALNVTKKGFRYIYINKVTVGYRLGDSSFNSSTKIFNDFYKKEYNFKEKYIFPYASSRILKYHNFEHKRKIFFEKFSLNKKTIINKILYRLATYANPYQY